MAPPLDATPSDLVELSLGGVSVADALDARQRELVDLVLSALVEQIYGPLPDDEITGDIAEAVRRGLTVCADMLRTGAPPTADALEATQQSAARRAEEGIPLELMLSAFPIAARTVWEHVIVGVGPDDVGNVVEITSRLLDFLQVIGAAAAQGYLEEHTSITATEQALHLRLLDALLDGTVATETAARAGYQLPAEFYVVALAIGEGDQPPAPGVDANIAQRRSLRRLRDRIDATSTERALSSISADGGVALVPIVPDPNGDPRPTRDDLDAAIAEAAEITGAPVTAAFVAAEPARVVDGVPLTHQILELAVSLRKPPGLYGTEDLDLELQLTSPGPARHHLARRIAPLDGRTDLIDTLRTFLETDKNRRQTALLLDIHANTVDNRLRRVARLTGLDPVSARDSLVLTAALAAAAVDAERPRDREVRADPGARRRRGS